MQLHVSDLKEGATSYWYLGSPYSKWAGGQDDAWHEICKIGGRLTVLGVPLYSPIAHTHCIAVKSNLDPLSHDLWMPADKWLVDKAMGGIMAGMPGWRDSYGMGLEIQWFKEAKKPVWLLDPQSLSIQPL